MKREIILAGVGGQGILTLAKTVYSAAKMEGLQVKQAEVHGMSQRGGSVESQIRISDQLIFSPLVSEGSCDLIISTEPLEALRQARFLKEGGAIVTSGVPLKNMAQYPSEEFLAVELKKLGEAKRSRVMKFDPSVLAVEAGNAHAQNSVLLGAAAPLTGLSTASLRAALSEVLASKGATTVSINLKAFDLGMERAGRDASQIA